MLLRCRDPSTELSLIVRFISVLTQLTSLTDPPTLVSAIGTFDKLIWAFTEAMGNTEHSTEPHLLLERFFIPKIIISLFYHSIIRK